MSAGEISNYFIAFVSDSQDERINRSGYLQTWKYGEGNLANKLWSEFARVCANLICYSEKAHPLASCQSGIKMSIVHLRCHLLGRCVPGEWDYKLQANFRSSIINITYHDGTGNLRDKTDHCKFTRFLCGPGELTGRRWTDRRIAHWWTKVHITG